jgi:Zn finger protein HypA/HybF involved in hydrogenase expression
MGTLYHFECRSCGYSAEVSGGDDRGMRSRTTTILCETCSELHDVVTSTEPWIDEMVDPETLKCPKSKRHIVRKWEHPGICPKCGQDMDRVGMACLWD